MIIILLIPVSGASDIFDILDEKYITNISELPYSSGNPDKNIQKSGNIRGWIDITGFRNLTKENGTYYVNTQPSVLAIIQEDAWGEFKCSICSYSIEKSVSSWNSSDYTYANLYSKMVWYEKVYTKNGYKCVKHIEYAVFQDSELSPLQYPALKTRHVNITEYNNSVNPRTVFELVFELLTSNLSMANYTYNNISIINYLKNARVEKTGKGIYFANMSSANIWTDGTDSFHQMGDKVIIRGTADPDYDNLSITVSNIYETQRVSNYSIVRDTYKFERSFSGLYITLIIIFSILFGTLYYTAKRACS